MKVFLLNNGLFHHCPELKESIVNRYLLIKELDVFRCDLCPLEIPTMLVLGSEKTHIANNIYRLGQIESFDKNYFEKNNIKCSYIEI